MPYVYGSGSYGCPYDFCGTAETQAEAVDVLAGCARRACHLVAQLATFLSLRSSSEPW